MGITDGLAVWMLAGIFLLVLFITCPHLDYGKLGNENGTVVFCFCLSVITAAFQSVMVCRSGSCLPQLSHLWVYERVTSESHLSPLAEGVTLSITKLAAERSCFNHSCLTDDIPFLAYLLITKYALLCATLASCNLSLQFLCSSHLCLLMVFDPY